MDTSKQHPLSPRERQILKCAENGYTDAAIARLLSISEATVGTYWARIRMKLGSHGRTELVSLVLKAEDGQLISDLRKENEDLHHQVEALMRSREELICCTDLVDCVPESVVVVNESGLIECANMAARDLFGYDRAELEGLGLDSLIPERYRVKHREHQSEFLKNPHRLEMGEHFETPALHKNGTEFPIRATLAGLRTPRGLMVSCVMKSSADVTQTRLA